MRYVKIKVLLAREDEPSFVAVRENPCGCAHEGQHMEYRWAWQGNVVKLAIFYASRSILAYLSLVTLAD